MADQPLVVLIIDGSPRVKRGRLKLLYSTVRHLCPSILSVMGTRRWIAGLLIAIGLLANEWLIEWLLVDDGHIESIRVRWIIRAFQLVAIVAGLGLWRRRRPLGLGWHGNWLILAVSAIASIGLAESTLRFLPGFEPSPRTYVGEHANRPSRNFVADEKTGWRMHPHNSFSWSIGETRNHYRSNAAGFRSDREFDVDETRSKILLVGDSFTFGTGVDYDETYGALIEADRPGSVVYNLAMPGFGVDQMWMALRHQALPLDPRLVIVAFIDHDFDRSLSAYRRAEGFNKPLFAFRDGVLVRQSPADRPGALWRALEARSALHAALTAVWRGLSFSLPVGDWWQRNAAVLTAIQDECRSAGVPVLFVRIPLEGAPAFPTLATHLERNSSAFLDLAHPPAYGERRIFITNDGHINVAGHRYVADAIGRWLRQNLRPRPDSDG